MQVHHPGTWQRQILKGGDAAVRTPCGAPQIVFSVRIRAVPELLKRTVRRLTLRRAPVDADSATALILQKEPPHYPEAARKAGIQGTVVLEVATACSGDVKEVTVVAGGSRPGANSDRHRHGPSAVGAGTGI
jgi:hypothetical protein